MFLKVRAQGTSSRSNPHTYTDEDDMLSIHDIHSQFPEDMQVGIGAVRDDVAVREESIVLFGFCEPRETRDAETLLL
ncbi:hypothetical protein ACFQ38_14365 [Sporosarcina contaminans]|uniref:Uncharacterized protein n=1 Tax=Sporosarcina contaminans TaxID=633403 RepID=A0ABW3U0X5_9BACL